MKIYVTNNYEKDILNYLLHSKNNTDFKTLHTHLGITESDLKKYIDNLMIYNSDLKEPLNNFINSNSFKFSITEYSYIMISNIFITHSRQKGIIEYIMTANSLAEALSRINERQIEAYTKDCGCKICIRNIKDYLRDIRKLNKENILISFIHGKKYRNLEYFNLMKQLPIQKINFILLDRNTIKDICVLCHTAIQSNNKEFSNKDFTEKFFTLNNDNNFFINGYSKRNTGHLLKNFVRNNEIIKLNSNNKKSIRYCINFKKNPKIIDINDVNVTEMFLNSVIKKNIPLYEQVVFYVKNSNRYDYSNNIMNYPYFLIQKGIHIMNYNNLLLKLKDANCKDKTINITIEKNGTKKTFYNFHLRNMIYSAEKDKLYLLGITQIATQNKNSIFIAENITDITPGNKDNIFKFSKNEYSIYDEMINVSEEESHNVTVRFYPMSSEKIDGKIIYNYGNLKLKINTLANNRSSTAKIIEYEKEGYYEYKDTIRGLNDFANLLRQFGRSCEVIEPPKLRELMKSSAEKILNLYSEN